MVGILTGMTTTIINGACGIGINAGHRTTRLACPDNIRFEGPNVYHYVRNDTHTYMRVRYT